MKTLRKYGSIFLLLAISLSAAAMPALAGGDASSPPDDGVQEQIDILIADYEIALEKELRNGETEVIYDPIDGEVTLLAGASADKMDALWQETLQKIDDLLARPLSERASAIEAIRAIDDTEVTYIEKTGSPYNRDATLEIYQTELFIYSVDINTNQIIEWLLLDDWTYGVEPIYSQDELEVMAREVIDKVGGINLEELSPNFGSKMEETFFFRWEDPSGKLDGDMHPFVQVGFSRRGDFLNYINTFPLADQASKLSQGLSTDAFAPAALISPVVSPWLARFLGINESGLLTYFNQVYANGGSYWQRVYGSMNTQSNAGYCYIAGWCSPKNFYYANTCYGSSSVKGRWKPNTNPTVRPYAFIPSTHATTLMACYRNYYNGGSSMHGRCRNQSIYYNAWIYTSYSRLYNIKKIDLSNEVDGGTTREIAWDETWLYSPY